MNFIFYSEFNVKLKFHLRNNIVRITMRHLPYNTPDFNANQYRKNKIFMIDKIINITHNITTKNEILLYSFFVVHLTHNA